MAQAYTSKRGALLEIEFLEPELERLYLTKKSRKYRLQPQVVTKFFMRIGQIEAADSIFDFWRTGSLNFERMQGTEDEFSMRVDLKWRLIIRMRWGDEGRTKGTALILDLSEHYGG